jgi:hypothetical protein
MKTETHSHPLTASLVAGLVLAGLNGAFAGPVRPIISSQLSQQAPAPNGPPPDPTAQQGQWFINVMNGSESANSWELHDSDDSLSIHGKVVAIQWGLGVPVAGYTNIAGFSILVTVSNNLSPATLVSGGSTNSHAEVQLAPQPRFLGMMWRARIAAEFAVAQAGPGGPPFVGMAPNVSGMTPPYYLDPGSAGQYVIEAQNETLAAWYCFQVPVPPNPAGAYYVPAWELGDIPPGGSAQVLMHFLIKTYGGVPTEMPYTDLRHGVVRYSYLNGGDVLYNRSESLKISHWIDLMLVDAGNLITSIPYPGQEPVEYVYASDVSVFFDSAGPADRPVLSITPVFSNQTLSAIQLRWMANDAGPFVLQYCDNLASNNWTPVSLNLSLPPMIPGPMIWTDDGTMILPPLTSPRFYRLFMP